MGILEVTFFVNAAGLFFLSALIEKSANAKKEYKQKDITTVKMPAALIEGAETLILFSFIILFPKYMTELYILFASGVIITIIQRAIWAKKHL